MCRIYVRRTAESRFRLFKTAFPCNEVLWDRRLSETVSRRWNERRRVPPDSWDELDFVAEASPPVTEESTELSATESTTLFRLAETLLTDIVDRLRTPRLPSTMP